MSALERKSLPGRGLCVALVAGNFMDFRVAPAVTHRAGSLAIRSGYEVQDTASSLAGILNVSRNIHHLLVNTTSISGLAYLLDGPLLRLRHAHIVAEELSRHELADLLKLMPNLRHAAVLPLLPLNSEPLHGPENIHLDHITFPFGYDTALPLLISRRWTARTVEFLFSSETWECLERVDWTTAPVLPEIVSLHMVINQPGKLGTASALHFISACSALRCLRLRASGDDLCHMLTQIIGNDCRLQRLNVEFQYFATLSEHVIAVAGLLRDAIPTLPALRVLDISAFKWTLLLADLVPLCRLRRIACRFQ